MVETCLVDDGRKIKSLYGAGETWQVTVSKLTGIENIETYLEDGDVVWFAIYKEGRIVSRINSRYVESVQYSRLTLPDAPAIIAGHGPSGQCRQQEGFGRIWKE